MISRRLMLSTLMGGLVAGAAPLWANPPQSSLRPVPRGGKPFAQAPAAPAVPATPEALLEAAKLGAAVTGFIVLDALSGQILESHGTDAKMPPASVAKAVTSLFALDRLGPDFRYRTTILATGPVIDNVVQGDLILCGDGDPTLQTDDLGDLAAALAAKGIRGVTGSFLIWEGSLPLIAQISEEQPVQVGYNPGLSGLNLNYNRVNFEWKRAGSNDWKLTMDARGSRFVPPVRMAQIKVSSRATPIFTYEDQGEVESWTVASGALGKGGSRWLPVRHPGLYAGEVFHTLAKAQGIALPLPQSAKAVPTGHELAAVESEPMTEILRDMLRYSTNVIAEAVGLRASEATSLAASGQAMTAWVQSRFGVRSEWHDHSGLGSASRVSVGDMSKILLEARQAGLGLEPLLRNQGLRDSAGKEIPNSPTRIAAKTGTLNFVSGLAGYVEPPEGRALVFAVASADVVKRDALGMTDRESPPGGDVWLARARTLQQQLLRRWATVYLQQA